MTIKTPRGVLVFTVYRIPLKTIPRIGIVFLFAKRDLCFMFKITNTILNIIEKEKRNLNQTY